MSDSDDEFESANEMSDDGEITASIQAQFLVKDLDTGRIINLLQDGADQDLVDVATPAPRRPDAVESRRHSRRASGISESRSHSVKEGRRYKFTSHHINGPVLHSMEEINVATEHVGAIWALGVSPSRTMIATGGRDTILRLWSVNQEGVTLTSALTGHKGDILDVVWSITDFVLSSSADGSVRLWHTTRDECLTSFKHPAGVTSADIHPVNDQFVVTACMDGIVRLMDVAEQKTVARVALGSTHPSMVRFSPDGRKIVVGTVIGHVKVYDATDLRYLTGWTKRHPGRVTGLSFIDSGTLMVTTNDSRLRMFALDTLVCTRKYLGHTADQLPMRCGTNTDGTVIGCGGDDGSVYLWPRNPEYTPTLNPIFTRFRRDHSKSFMVTRPGKAPVVNVALFGPSTMENIMVVTADADGTLRAMGRGTVTM